MSGSSSIRKGRRQQSKTAPLALTMCRRQRPPFAIVINEQEAEIVRWMFEAYASGIGSIRERRILRAVRGGRGCF
jgi:hypothetical protein